ncbi:MAG: tRNA (adenosine(37)-N6)-threonylcarbamoyltransferase complex transferase subunit TsaD [Coriobacteriia bacterium]|nr:tRNA (adenosine(37)-N6)-threonylcarbamoyltransferase complex transferase subunit TsaD [Coriobacteriia bacterium]
MKYLLAFDTSGDEIILVAAQLLVGGSTGKVLIESSLQAKRAANTQLLTLIDAALASADITRDQLGAIAVGTTLGSYTGVRIGVAAAKGIAQALAIPLYGLELDPGNLNPQQLLSNFTQAQAFQSGYPSAVLPQYTRMSYAEEAEQKQHPQRYPADDAHITIPFHSEQDPIIPERSEESSAPQHPQLLLGIETSCDETAVALMSGTDLLSNVIASQVVFHARFGGVVPEIASRKHSEAIVATVDEAIRQAGVSLTDLTGIAVTDRPGLIGALVVGHAYAKALGWALQIPVYGINHLEGHLYACALDGTDLPVPHVTLIVSGGHTTLVHCPRPFEYETMGETLDDAAGEAFDKVAKVLGLGYPGGPILSKLAESGNPHAIDFPRAMLHSKDYAFSLSGLKTAVITYIREAEQAGQALNIPDIAASFQQAVVDVQVAKAVRAVQETDVKHFILAGGVAANKVLRTALTEALADIDVEVLISPLEYCGDNAAMIVRAAVARLQTNELACKTPSAEYALNSYLQPLPLTADASSTGSLDTSL